MSKLGYTSNNLICPMVEAACCIVDKGRGYDIENDFNGWVKKWIKEKLGIE